MASVLRMKGVTPWAGVLLFRWARAIGEMTEARWDAWANAETLRVDLRIAEARARLRDA